ANAEPLAGVQVTGPAVSSASVALIVHETAVGVDDWAAWSPPGVFTSTGGVVSGWLNGLTVTSKSRWPVLLWLSVDWQSSWVTPMGKVSPGALGGQVTGPAGASGAVAVGGPGAAGPAAGGAEVGRAPGGGRCWSARAAWCRAG